jgi:hypothetical protein
MKESAKRNCHGGKPRTTGPIGMAVELGSYDVAMVLSGATIITLWVLSPLKPN